MTSTLHRRVHEVGSMAAIMIQRGEGWFSGSFRSLGAHLGLGVPILTHGRHQDYPAELPRGLVISDRRGVAALEFAILAPFILALVLPITDIAIVVVRYIDAYQTLRSLGAYATYNPPLNISDATYMAGYMTEQLAKASSGETKYLPATPCGDTLPCTTPTSPPVSLLFSATFHVSPIIFDLGCSGGCTVTYLQPLR